MNVTHISFLDGYCSTVQGLLGWFEVDLGFTELSFIQIGLCVLGVVGGDTHGASRCAVLLESRLVDRISICFKLGL